MLSTIAIVLFYLIMGFPAAVIGLPWTLLSRDISFLYRWAMWIANAGLKVGGIRIDVSGREELDSALSYIFMSNHVSNLDPPVLLPLLPGRTSVFLKRSLMKIPLLGYAMRLGDFVPVDRDGRVESAKQSVERARQVMTSGLHITSFVEGTRSRDGRLLPFKKGPFYLAMESGSPVVPISIWGTENMMKKGSMRITPGTAHVVFHTPLWPRDYPTREELLAAVRQSIASSLPEWMRGESAVLKN
ncbi:1-acyl-sn-glycerol-3-phosphate acyltransferase [Alloacidobacterium dinghuense]|uniref:1-acyl-sn-glycerol-3-phosphate acyltransferase n=1 Tax=Alloacidobacterium dinghuense TaxID=2763107 RepID=A0A7G8BCY3_9BACT|nr:lysophospholipid acyltransferase family protein [Alloacidobacterium dinghuense]QNI30403.1 1-acyl-sn-glycerol-3-phosphate acyltransferase [Alloacidobacterium dinghuense]